MPRPLLSLSAACGGSDLPDSGSDEMGAPAPDMGAPTMSLSCAADDPAYVDKALSCYPACVQRILGPCLGQGMCKSGGRYLGNGNSSVKLTYDNCIEVEGSNILFAGSGGTVKKAGALCYTYRFVENDVTNTPTTITSPAGSFVIHPTLSPGPNHVDCDATSFPLDIKSGCNGIFLNDRGLLQVVANCR